MAAVYTGSSTSVSREIREKKKLRVALSALGDICWVWPPPAPNPTTLKYVLHPRGATLTPPEPCGHSGNVGGHYNIKLMSSDQSGLLIRVAYNAN